MRAYRPPCVASTSPSAPTRWAAAAVPGCATWPPCARWASTTCTCCPPTTLDQFRSGRRSSGEWRMTCPATPPTVRCSRRRCWRWRTRMLSTGAMTPCTTACPRAAMPQTLMAPAVSWSTGRWCRPCMPRAGGWCLMWCTTTPLGRGPTTGTACLTRLFPATTTGVWRTGRCASPRAATTRPLSTPCVSGWWWMTSFTGHRTTGLTASALTSWATSC
mmetsp:Transcript_33843/g.75047  ORF Transcript_33843/g.75047 Transcript_33843/m.75047 type:complete len:217 (+) Transcript_33843:716-1366(+)